MKIAILNAKYSPNLGDGAIADCLEFQIKKHIKSAEVVSIDIGGSDDYGGSNSMIPEKASFFNAVTPDTIQKLLRFLLRPTLLKRKFFTKWKNQLKNCDAIIIGGGQLFMDSHLYFPTRISMMVKAARKNTPIFVHAVGVSENITPTGKRYFNSIFQHGKLINATVRDPASLENWKKHFPEHPCEIALDPALLAKESYTIKKDDKQKNLRTIVGFGVSNPDNMLTHAGTAKNIVGTDVDFFLKSIKDLVKHNCDIHLFSNGDDQKMLDRVKNNLNDLDKETLKHVSVLERPLIPTDLIKQIIEFDIIIAHRLHANILSFAYKIPSIGLMWDQKLKSFFKVINRQKFLIEENKPDLIIEKFKEIKSSEFNDNKHQEIMDDTNKSIEKLTQLLTKLS